MKVKLKVIVNNIKKISNLALTIKKSANYELTLTLTILFLTYHPKFRVYFQHTLNPPRDLHNNNKHKKPRFKSIHSDKSKKISG